VQQADGAANAGADTVVDVQSGGGRGGAEIAACLLPPSFSLDAPLESVTVAGSMVSPTRTCWRTAFRPSAAASSVGEGEFGQPGQVGAGGVLPGAGGFGAAGGNRIVAAGGGGGGRGGGAPGLDGRIGANRMQVNATYGRAHLTAAYDCGLRHSLNRSATTCRTPFSPLGRPL
jgi:hypothetical protein